VKELTIKPFKVEDLKTLGLKEEQLRLYEEAIYSFTSWTVTCKGETVFCGGVQEVMPKVGEAWLIFSEHGRGYVAALKTAKRLLKYSIKHFRRIQAAADPSIRENPRFLKHLGFVYEGTLRSYGLNGEDMGMYSIIREDL